MPFSEGAAVQFQERLFTHTEFCILPFKNDIFLYVWVILQQFLEQSIADIKALLKGLIGHIVTIVPVNMKKTAFFFLVL